MCAKLTISHQPALQDLVVVRMVFSKFSPALRLPHMSSHPPLLLRSHGSVLAPAPSTVSTRILLLDRCRTVVFLAASFSEVISRDRRSLARILTATLKHGQGCAYLSSTQALPLQGQRKGKNHLDQPMVIQKIPLFSLVFLPASPRIQTLVSLFLALVNQVGASKFTWKPMAGPLRNLLIPVRLSPLPGSRLGGGWDRDPVFPRW